MIVCALGDLTLDVIVRLGGPMAVGGDTEAEIHLGPGGQAANVAAWAAALGADARFVGKRGDDEQGRLALAGLAATGVVVLGPDRGPKRRDLRARDPGRGSARWLPTAEPRANFGPTNSIPRG